MTQLLDRQIARHDASTYQASVNYKAMAFAAESNQAAIGYELKRARAVWDPKLRRFRCPEGVTGGGQVTNRAGAGCGVGVVRRTIRGLVNAGQRLEAAIDRGRAGRAILSRDRRRRRSRARAARRERGPGRVRRLEGAALDRLADAFDQTGRPDRRERRRQNRGRLLDRAADFVDPDSPNRRERRRDQRRIDEFRIDELEAELERRRRDPDDEGRRDRRGRLLDRAADLLDRTDPDLQRGREERRERRRERRGRRLDQAADLFDRTDPDVQARREDRRERRRDRRGRGLDRIADVFDRTDPDVQARREDRRERRRDRRGRLLDRGADLLDVTGRREREDELAEALAPSRRRRRTRETVDGRAVNRGRTSRDSDQLEPVAPRRRRRRAADVPGLFFNDEDNRRLREIFDEWEGELNNRIGDGNPFGRDEDSDQRDLLAINRALRDGDFADGIRRLSPELRDRIMADLNPEGERLQGEDAVELPRDRVDDEARQAAEIVEQVLREARDPDNPLDRNDVAARVVRLAQEERDLSDALAMRVVGDVLDQLGRDERADRNGRIEAAREGLIEEANAGLLDPDNLDDRLQAMVRRYDIDDDDDIADIRLAVRRHMGRREVREVRAGQVRAGEFVDLRVGQPETVGAVADRLMVDAQPGRRMRLASINAAAAEAGVNGGELRREIRRRERLRDQPEDVRLGNGVADALDALVNGPQDNNVWQRRINEIAEEQGLERDDLRNAINDEFGNRIREAARRIIDRERGGEERQAAMIAEMREAGIPPRFNRAVQFRVDQEEGNRELVQGAARSAVEAVDLRGENAPVVIARVMRERDLPEERRPDVVEAMRALRQDNEQQGVEINAVADAIIAANPDQRLPEDLIRRAAEGGGVDADRLVAEVARRQGPEPGQARRRRRIRVESVDTDGRPPGAINRRPYRNEANARRAVSRQRRNNPDRDWKVVRNRNGDHYVVPESQGGRGAPRAIEGANAYNAKFVDSPFGVHRDVDGVQVGGAVEVGNGGMNNANDAVRHLEGGGSLDEVPDIFLKQAILRLRQNPDNPNEGRFRLRYVGAGINDAGAENERTFHVVDTVTGRRYILKSPTFHEREYLGEMVALDLGRALGAPQPRVRVAGSQRAANGNYPLLMENVGDVIDGEFFHFTREELRPFIDRGLDPLDELVGNKPGHYIMKFIDGFLNNPDRHMGNFFVGRDGGDIVMIDNGGIGYGLDLVTVQNGKRLVNRWVREGGGRLEVIRQMRNLRRDQIEALFEGMVERAQTASHKARMRKVRDQFIEVWEHANTVNI